MLFEAFLSTAAMEAVFAPSAVVQSMMDVEAALARAQARAGLLPVAAAQAIASLCRAELYDVAALLAAAPRVGNLTTPVVQRLRETVALFDPAAAVYVHRGVTAQDIADTAMVLRTKEALRLIDDDLQTLCADLLALAERHEAVPMLGRTLMQPAQVISLRFKVMNWLMPILRSAEQLRRQADDALRLQLGGAVGTLDSMGDKAPLIIEQLSLELDLPAADMCWHTQRDRWMRLGAELGVLCGSLGKLAQDIALLSQAEVDEFSEPQLDGRGVCTSMPHKNNPVAAQQALAAVQRAPHRVAALLACLPQQHERGLGQAQAEQAEWTGLLGCAHAALQALTQVMAAPVVRAERMREHVHARLGLVASERLEAALLTRLGRQRTTATMQDLIHRVRQGQGRLDELVRSAVVAGELPADALPDPELRAMFDMDAAARSADERVVPVVRDARRRCEVLASQPRR